MFSNPPNTKLSVSSLVGEEVTVMWFQITVYMALAMNKLEPVGYLKHYVKTLGCSPPDGWMLVDSGMIRTCEGSPV
jgi:hypothetical protein